jgi:predicted phage gp36 major capsid-like protein
VGSPDGVGSPNEGTPGCAVDAKGIQLPADAIERLEQWLCALTGRSVTVIGKPLELLSPVSGDAARSASKRTLAVGQAAVRLRVTQAASATHTRSATKAEKSDRAASKAKKSTGSRTSAKPESDRDRNDRDKSGRDKSDRHNDGSRKDKARDGRSHGSASRADSRRGHGNHRSDRGVQATVDDVSGSATGYSGRHRR